MEKVLIVGCKKAMDDVCIGCSRCLVAFNRREGYFELYQDEEAEVIGLLNCGDCPGATVVTRLAQFNLWNMPMRERPTAIHIGPCIVSHCPHARAVIDKIRAAVAVPVVEGTHQYLPKNLFAPDQAPDPTAE